jgi:hypothetical protein
MSPEWKADLVSDIALHITWLDLLIAAPVFGWPGLLIGGALGARAWRRRRIAGGVIGALLGCVIWFAVPMLLR